MGPNLNNVTRVLSRIEEINRRIMPDMYSNPAEPLKSKFVDVLNDVNREAVYQAKRAMQN